MAKKLNKILRKKYTEKKFNKKILNRLFLEDEKKAVLEFFKTENGFYIPSETDDKKKIKQLNRIAKTVKNNSGALGIGKTGALISVIILTILFSIFLKNPLAEKGLEKGLEAAFGAEAEIDSLNLSLTKGDIKFKALRVTDKDNPDRNLFETGRAEIDINMEEALKGKFNARTIELEYLSIDTKRKTKGKVQNKEKAEESDKESVLPSFKAPDISTDIVKKAIEENLNKLSTPAELERIKNSYETAKKEIEEGIKESEEDLEKLKKTAEEIKSVEINSPLEVDKIKKLTENINSAVKTADSLLDDIDDTGKQFNSVSKLAGSSTSIIEKAAGKDFSLLAEKLNPAQSFDLKSYVKDYIMDSFSPFLKKYEKAFEIAAKLKKEKSEKAPEKKVKRGRVISFPVIGNRPKFLIEKTAGSFIDGDKVFSMAITSITNNQELTGKPVSFALDYIKDNENINLAGFFDNREAREKNSGAELKIPSVNFSLKDFLPGLKSAEGVYKLESSLAIEKDRSLSGSAEIKTSEYKTEGTDDITGKAVSAALNKNIPIEFSLAFRTGKELKLDSNLDSVLKNAIAPSELSDDQKNLIKTGIEDYFKDNVLENSQIADEISSLQGELDSIKSSVEKEKNTLKKKLDSAVKTDEIEIPGADKIKLPKKLW